MNKQGKMGIQAERNKGFGVTKGLFSHELKAHISQLLKNRNKSDLPYLFYACRVESPFEHCYFNILVNSKIQLD
jgi:hypothetical protein